MSLERITTAALANASVNLMLRTTCPVAVVPAPPAVIVIAPSEAIVPARLPATPPAVVVVLPKHWQAGDDTTAHGSDVGVASPSI